jgi:DNA polymerase III delta subunit
MTPKQVREHIARGECEPLYLVTGDDEGEMGALASLLADSVDEELRAFNVQRFYGTDSGTTLAAVLDAAGTFPLLASRRVVLLMQAQVLLTGRRARPTGTTGARGAGGAGGADEPEEGGEEEFSEFGTGSDLSLLKDYAERPYAHAVVAVFGQGLQRQFRALAKRAAVVTCEASDDVLVGLERELGVRFDVRARRALNDRSGGDVARLRDDVERIALFAAGRTEIGEAQVLEVVSRPEAARGAKQLWTEVANRRAAAALKELRLEMAEGASPYMVLGLLRSVVERRTAPRDLPRALEALLRTDLSLKTSGGDPQVLLERLVVELCALGRD